MVVCRTFENSIFSALRSFALSILVCSVVLWQNTATSQTLIVNEVSNGPAGNQEYIELVVVSQTAYYDCGVSTPPCIDIRGWILDDNSGYHGSSGIAPGAVRFSFDPIWQCVPLGTIILIYNNGDPNTSLPAQDLSMTDGNCAIVAPISNTSLFETNTTTPGAIACSYPAGGWTAGGNWSSVVLANGGDCVRLVDLSGCEVFSLCNGTDNQSNMIYFAGSGVDDVWYFNGGNPFLQANWSEGCADNETSIDAFTCGSNMQTPGAPNNAANAAYIAQFNNGCQPITPISVSATSTIDNCNCSGTATASASGSIPGYTYAWYNATFQALGQTTATATGLCSGTYYVIASSSINCKDTAMVVVGQNSPATVSVNSAGICSGSSTTLSAIASPAGGTFSWSPTNATTASISVSPLSTSTYIVSYTSLGCTVTAVSTVNVNATPTVNAGADISICAGQFTALSGAIGATASSGLWSTTTGTIVDATSLTTNFDPGIPSGTITLTLTTNDPNGPCPASSDQVIISVNSVPTVNAGADVVVCPGATATLTATGANTYSWSPLIQNGVPFTPATAGTYTVTGTSSAGCVNTDQVLVSLGTNPTIVANDVTACSNGTVILTASGASTYSWSPATNLSSPTGASVTFTAGTTTTYTVTGTSATGCIGTDQAIVTVSASPSVNAGSDVSICAGQSTVLTAAGATTYQWTGLAAGNGISVSPTVTTTYTVSATGANGCVSTDQVVVTFNALPIVNGGPDINACPNTPITLTATGANTYSWNPSIQNGVGFTPTTTTNFQVTGTSNLGCTATDLVLVTVLPAPSLSTPNVATCQNGTVNVVATGAQSYTWSPATNLSGITGGTLIFTAGNTTTYTIVGTSANGCTASSNLVVTVNPLPSTNAGTDVSICSGQSTTLTATGANTYTWTGASGNPITVSPAATTSYTVTGTSSVGCTNTDQVTVTVNPLPTINGGADVTVCSGQPVTLTATGTTTYSWNPAITNGVSFNPTTTATYVVTGTSALGCTATDNVLVTVNPIPIVVVNDVALCIGGTVALTASGATTYAWSPATNLSATTGANLTFTAGLTTSYTIIGTSAAGCVGTDNATVTVNALPVVNAGVDQVVCEGNQITLTATGGTTYSWNPAATNGTAFTPALGTTLYTVTATNANGCIATDQVSVLVNPNPIVNAGVDISLCLGDQATLSASGAQTYSWSGSVVDGAPFTPAATNTYTVTGTSTAGCTSTDALTITVNPIPTVNAGLDVETCAGQNVTLAGSGAAIYTWDGGAVNNQPFLPPTGTTVYTLTGTSAAGCVDTDQVSVLVNPNFQATFFPSETFGCAPVSVTLYNTTAGGSIDCSWTLNGVTLQGCDSVSFVLESSGCLDVTLSVNAANGCSSTVTQANLICVEETPVADFAALPNVITVFDPPVQFLNTSSGGAQYIWDFGDGSPLLEANDPTHDYSQDSVGAYLVTLLATSPSGCTDTAYAFIQIIDDVIFYVPNSFTPDGDIINQTFQPVFTSGFDPAEYSMRIFNRWGEVVFETNDAAFGWDGGYGDGSNYKMMQDGNYTWKIEFTVLQTDERIMKVGHVNLLR